MKRKYISSDRATFSSWSPIFDKGKSYNFWHDSIIHHIIILIFRRKFKVHHTIILLIFDQKKPSFANQQIKKSDFKKRKRKKKVHTTSSLMLSLCLKKMRPRVMKCLVHSHTLLFFKTKVRTHLSLYLASDFSTTFCSLSHTWLFLFLF